MRYSVIASVRKDTENPNAIIKEGLRLLQGVQNCQMVNTTWTRALLFTVHVDGQLTNMAEWAQPLREAGLHVSYSCIPTASGQA